MTGKSPERGLQQLCGPAPGLTLHRIPAVCQAVFSLVILVGATAHEIGRVLRVDARGLDRVRGLQGK